MLDAIINPSAAIVFGYEPWIVNTKDGQSVYGFLISDNKQTMVIRDIHGQNHVIKKSDISSKQKQEKSLMPDPVSNGLNEKGSCRCSELFNELAMEKFVKNNLKC